MAPAAASPPPVAGPARRSAVLEGATLVPLLVPHAAHRLHQGLVGVPLVPVPVLALLKDVLAAPVPRVLVAHPPVHGSSAQWGRGGQSAVPGTGEPPRPTAAAALTFRSGPGRWPRGPGSRGPTGWARRHPQSPSCARCSRRSQRGGSCGRGCPKRDVG